MFDKYKVQYNILTVVHKETAEHIKEIYKAYKKRGWKYLQFITCLDPLGEERGQQKYSLKPEAYGKFLADLFDMWYEDFQRDEQPFIRQFENYVMIRLRKHPESCEQRGICGYQNVVEADGSVYPCDFYVLDDYCLGNFNNTSLKAIYDKRDEINFIQRSFNHPQECKDCQWFFLCRGGCYRSRIDSGEDNTAINYFCQGYKYFFEHCNDRISEIARLVSSVMR